RLALLYSGNFGRAHSYTEILDLARRLEPDGARLVFSVRGNSVKELREAAANQSNVSFLPFASPDRIEERLSAADIHVVTLRERWTGTVVPSKFFGALAVGRPVLFAGSADSAIARWIEEHRVGWVLSPETTDKVVRELRVLSETPTLLTQLFQHCHSVYQD